jgi:hypothetical protein
MANLHRQILRFICLAIEADIGEEVFKCLAGKPPKQDLLKQLPHLSKFLDTPQGAGQLSSVNEQNLLVSTLAMIRCYTLPLRFFSIGHGLTKKGRLQKQVDAKLSGALRHVCVESTASTLQASVRAESLKVRAEVKKCNKDFDRLAMTRLQALVGVNQNFLNLATASYPGSTAVTTLQLKAMRDEHAGKTRTRTEDWEHGMVMIDTHVNPKLDEEESP